MSHAQLGRLERGVLKTISLDQLSRAAAALGLRVSVRLYPDGDPVRDAGQLAVLERFQGRLPSGVSWRTEVPLPIAGDRRAWDGVASSAGRRIGCEVETRPRDVQALERRLALKARDGDVDCVLLILAETRHNRQFLDLHRSQLRTLLPLDSRAVLATMAAGRLPAASGIVVL